ncbi:MAG TPA: exonuclease [Ruminococcaceae bacterium]|nr:exonuclease [Oscillospiraceae bacterium]
MNFIILDLEWNGAYSKRYKRFVNEIIEFGAVKVDGSFKRLGTFEALIKPQIGKKISGKVKDLTSITNEDLDGGLQFLQAMSKFRRWAGDCVIMTWGTSDILTLIENCRYFYGSRRVPFLMRYADLQAYCEKMLGCAAGCDQVGLGTAADALNIDASGFEHHRAVDDSMLELMCFEKLYDASALLPFIQNACTRKFYDRIEFKTAFIKDLSHPLINRKDLSFNCDVCGRPARRMSEWKLQNNSFKAEFFCVRCRHKFYGRVRFKLKYDGVAVKKAILQVNDEDAKRIKADNL